MTLSAGSHLGALKQTGDAHTGVTDAREAPDRRDKFAGGAARSPTATATRPPGDAYSTK